YDALVAGLSPEEKELRLASAERFIAAAATADPGNAAVYRTALDAARTAFNNRLTTYRNALAPATRSITTLRATVRTLLTTAPTYASFDLERVDLTEIEEPILAFSLELAERAEALATRLQQKHLGLIDADMQGFADIADTDVKADVLIKVAKTIFGEEFPVIPEFALTARQ